MAFRMQLEGAGPGRGVLRVWGCPDDYMHVALALRRNDQLYLAQQQLWQTTPYWHPMFSTEPLADGIRIDLGADLIAGIISAEGMPIECTLRLDDVEYRGRIRIKGELIGPDGASVPSAAPAEPPAGAGEPSPDDTLEPAPAAPAPRRRRGIWVPLAVVTLGLLLAAGALAVAWQQGWLDQVIARLWPADEPPPVVLEPPVPPKPPAPLEPEPEPEVVEALAPPLEPTRTGREFARYFLEQTSDREAIYRQAIESEGRGDCEAALLLYWEAAYAPGPAAQLARRYDPATFKATDCIQAADPNLAMGYYKRAPGDDIEAKRRLGLLMIGERRSGPIYEAGLARLREAARAGDAEAGRVLEAMGIGP